jgi:hypothetical protein
MDKIKIEGNIFILRLENIYNVWRSKVRIKLSFESILGRNLDAFVIIKGRHQENNKESMQPITDLIQ